ncbi:MAG: T9SS type A sorting domain-containing protein [Calditrichaeota bacterium]|nr:T9SS type A sorting domain-containing protein [Calditrichota bacterium]
MRKQKHFSWFSLVVILIMIHMLGFASSGRCQLSVVSMSPADGETKVDSVVTFEISFSAALDTSARFPMPGDFFLDLLIPEDSLLSPPDSVSLSADLKTVRLHNIRLFPDTRYFFGVLAAKSQAGDSLDQPAVVTFTTGATLPTGSVSGTVTFPNGKLQGALVALFPDLFEGAPLSGAVVDPSTGAYTISYVEPGTYFPITVKDVSGDGEADMFNQGDPMGIYDPNGDTIPDSISVAEGQLISGIDMELRLPETTTARQNIELAETFATTMFPDAFLAAVGAQGFQTDGSAILWMYFYMSPSEQKGISFIATSVISVWGVEEDLPPDAVALPDGWIDSDVAADTANAHGGLDFVNSHAVTEIMAQLFWIDLGKTGALSEDAPIRTKKIFGQKLTFPRQNSISAEARAVWLIDYWDQGTDDDLVILIDALSGEFIPINPPTGPPTTARFNLDAAKQAAQNWASDAQLGMVGQHQGDLTPDGKTETWFFYYFSTSLDSGKLFFLSNGQLIAERDPDWPLPTSKALPKNWIDSDAATAVAETNGGSDYRNSNSDVWVTAGVSRGFYPQLPDSAAWWIDYSSSTSDPLSILIDAVTGELIKPDTTTTEFTARYRLQDANQEAQNWASDAVLIHVGPGSPLPPDGKSSIWAYSYYSPSQNTGRIFYAMVAGPISSENLSARLPSNEALPENWIDSDVATAAAEANGGSAYRSRNPNAIMVGNTSKNMLEYYGRPSKAVWRFVYGSYSETTMFIFIDAVSGAHLSTKTDVATDARFNLEAANFCAQGFAPDAELTFVMNNTGSLDEQGRSSDSWLFSYYSSNKDDFISYQIIAGQVVFVYPFNGSPFASQDALPTNWMNSSQAVSIADAHGGSAYRGENVPVQGFLTKNFQSESYDVPAGTAVWLIQYLDTDFSVLIDAVTGEVILPSAVTSKNEQKIVPEDYSLSQNYPNPFNPETTIEYGIPRASNVEITIFNVQGEKIANVMRNFQQPGYHKIRWDGRNESGKPVASGIYLFQLKANDFTAVKKMLLLR